MIWILPLVNRHTYPMCGRVDRSKTRTGRSSTRTESVWVEILRHRETKIEGYPHNEEIPCHVNVRELQNIDSRGSDNPQNYAQDCRQHGEWDWSKYGPEFPCQDCKICQWFQCRLDRKSNNPKTQLDTMNCTRIKKRAVYCHVPNRPKNIIHSAPTWTTRRLPTRVRPMRPTFSLCMIETPQMSAYRKLNELLQFVPVGSIT